MKALSRLSLFCAVLLLAGFARAQNGFQVPPLTGPVIDEVGMMTRSDERQLERVLRRYNEGGRAQIQVLIVPDLGSLTLEEASIRVFDQWQLGQKNKDNGLLFLVAAKERRMRFEIGRGLEGTIPDVVAKRIQEEQIVPLFRAGRPSAGIMVGVSEILRLVDGEAASRDLQEEEQDFDGWMLLAIFIVFVLIQILRVASRGNFRGGGGPWIGSGSGWGGGSGGWGGGGGGGWSGGGGSSAGGGASSGW